MIEQGPAGFSVELHIIPQAHRKCCSFSISMVLHWSVKSSQFSVWHVTALEVWWEIGTKQDWVVPELPCFQARQGRNGWVGRTGSHMLSSVLPVQWITKSGVGHCCPYLLRVEQQLKTGTRALWGAAWVNNGPIESRPALPFCLVPMTLRRPGQFKCTHQSRWLLVMGEKDQTKLPALSNRNSHSEK